ncbi:MAG: zf-HC2 domain-containing protein [Treponema sp.]|jgi:anti-sigma factor RsiW|nr:zf-HC2 domain-containing protein [Treponema sp.]
MCPDRQILSLYVDGELPSPWKEKLEDHLASCPGCRAILESWEHLSAELRDEDEPGRSERVWEGIEARINTAQTLPSRESSGARRLGLPDLWHRRVSLPLPAAAALAAAAAAFVFVLGSMWLNPPAKAAAAATGLPFVSMEAGVDFTDMPVMDSTGLFQYLGSTDSSEIVIIRLPESRSFSSSGEPTIIRAADYTSGRLQQ